MEIVLVLALVVATLAVASTVALLISRRQSAHMNSLVDRLAATAGESFDGRLQTGTAELEHRRQAIDLRVEGMEKRLDEQLSGLGNQMSGEVQQLRGLVADLQKERARQHGQFVESLRVATQQQQRLTETTQQLSEVLANPQARGQWGERMAEDVLRAAGLREGLNYRKQTTTDSGTRPDFTFLLPDDRVLHMDVKFPIANYVRHLESESNIESDELCKRFLRDVRERVKELTTRGYTASDTTVGYMLMFIPNESVFAFIHQHDGELLEHALSRQIVMCSPSTLFAVLSIVRQSMDTLAVEQATEEIVDCLAKFGDQWHKFSAQVDKVEKHLDMLSNSFGDLPAPVVASSNASSLGSTMCESSPASTRSTPVWPAS